MHALQRGVKVKILLPGTRIDTEPVRRAASRARWGDLLKAGAEIHEYQPTMFHCKVMIVMIVDDVWVSVDSTNFDTRSFRLNDELTSIFTITRLRNARSTSSRTT
ncbi:MAG: phospholipase D-like domain-containing protein [Thiobacillus sp.]